MIVVAHKFPIEVQTCHGKTQLLEASGGLATALQAVVQNPDNTWVAACAGELTPKWLSHYMSCGFAIASFAQGLYKGFYWKISNGILWPTYHSLSHHSLPFSLSHWRDYTRVNLAFAQAAYGVKGQGEWIWVHDYQLSLVPAFLRQMGCEKKIAFFLHTPFPPWDVLRGLPSYRQILQGMLGANTIGFHTNDYRTNFLKCVSQALQVPVNSRGAVLYENRWIYTVVAPVGVAVQRIQRQVKKRGVQRIAAKLRKQMNVQHFVFGADRLDYTKGIDAKLRIVESLLQQNPSMRGNLVFLQLCVPTRQHLQAYQELKKEVQQLADRINVQLGLSNHRPVILLHGSLPREELFAWYAAADMALVTPWRDGMNLVAQEYVAARAPQAGSLVLSQFAGAAQEVLHDATLIDPEQIQESGQCIARELVKPESQKVAAMQHLFDQLLRYDISGFMEACLSSG
ncbi:MAG: trehalose-6-phosphate synthase [Myxococcota bacterium]